MEQYEATNWALDRIAAASEPRNELSETLDAVGEVVRLQRTNAHLSRIGAQLDQIQGELQCLATFHYAFANRLQRLLNGGRTVQNEPGQGQRSVQPGPDLAGPGPADGRESAHSEGASK